jgi:hypothetical protein
MNRTKRMGSLGGMMSYLLFAAPVVVLVLWALPIGVIGAAAGGRAVTMTGPPGVR